MYDQTVHLLDLCILSYHLHAQTLIWPLDPYYECSTPEKRRMEFMNALRTWCKDVRTLHGPGH
jgi:hypothetical protein